MVVLQARQLGNDLYKEAKSIAVSFDVKLKLQEISWGRCTGLYICTIPSTGYHRPS